MSTLYARKTAIIPLVAALTLAGKEGYAYKLNSSNEAVIVAAATDVPHGVIGAVTDDGLEISALPLGGNHGTVKVKLGAAVTDLRVDLTVKADGTFESDDGAGARVICARPLETGASGELIEAVLIPARKLGATVADTTTNGACSGAADLAALKTETEAMGDTLRALIASLQTAALIN